jgi:hypothetical protein
MIKSLSASAGRRHRNHIIVSARALALAVKYARMAEKFAAEGDRDQRNISLHIAFNFFRTAHGGSWKRK